MERKDIFGPVSVFDFFSSVVRIMYLIGRSGWNYRIEKIQKGDQYIYS